MKLCVLLIALVISSVNGNQLLHDADQLLSNHDPEGAIALYTTIIASEPTNAQALYKRAAAHLSLGRLSSAHSDLTTLLTVKAEFGPGYLERAKVRIKQGDWEGAMQDLEAHKTIEKADNTDISEQIKDAKHNLHIVKTSTDRKERLMAFEKLTRIANGATELFFKYAQELEDSETSEDKENAARMYMRAAVDPAFTDAHLKAARLLYYNEYRNEMALKYLKSCLRADPEHKECKAEFKAIKKLEKEITKVKDEFEGRRWSGVTRLSVGSDGVLEKIQKTSQNAKKVANQILEWTCIAYGKLQLPDKTIKWCSEAEGNAVVWETRADAYASKEEWQLAADDYERAGNMPKLQQVKMKLQHAGKNYYKILGVPKDASKREIQKAYRKLAKQWHPDTYRGDLPADQVAQKMSDINQAHEVLTDDGTFCTNCQRKEDKLTQVSTLRTRNNSLSQAPPLQARLLCLLLVDFSLAVNSILIFNYLKRLAARKQIPPTNLMAASPAIIYRIAEKNQLSLF